ncbi:LysR family transcriptional regulator [Kineococcus rhizosphaerae]|uniref:DNA-binding transcriptional LysR family regulator n=1 Tax=Kineococcus rhizosphaerae TaxID=559628 RepID=A0A2T0QZF5_9ACTN|nr:LysR family transcriptional regulator [Kineococcus rhizosphaerae]PRY12077.1 DNA-binding transcriptional LysR family regulator [Kineococcus rhizosphaerae]
MPTLRALELLVAVLDHGSLAEAARRLHTTPSAISHQLAALERELRTPLLHRLPRGVQATAAGRAVEADARRAVEAAAAVTRLGRAVAAGSAGRVRVACGETLTAPLVAPVLTRWRREHPDVVVELAEFVSADTLAAHLEAGRADLGVIPRPGSWTGEVHLVGREEVVAVVPPGHPLAGATTTTVADVAAHPVVGLTPGNGLDRWLTGLAADAGTVFDVVVRTRNASTAAHLARAGAGVAVVPVSALGGDPTGVVRFTPPLGRDVVVLLPAGGGDALAGRFLADLLAGGAPALA